MPVSIVTAFCTCSRVARCLPAHPLPVGDNTLDGISINTAFLDEGHRHQGVLDEVIPLARSYTVSGLTVTVNKVFGIGKNVIVSNVARLHFRTCIGIHLDFLVELRNAHRRISRSSDADRGPGREGRLPGVRCWLSSTTAMSPLATDRRRIAQVIAVAIKSLFRLLAESFFPLQRRRRMAKRGSVASAYR